ncbi:PLASMODESMATA CALLOSE-BINDING PROTEIN 1 [Eutrema salsugineum]|uniref:PLASMODESMATA CALLOSE-BINDING PROTEIN 1 n=1 Tax=Eutrema salsugineum TaxID=72664 RepID=UPI000CECE982|nr:PLASMODESMATA CALLOSE-BINDING PROTEIN 1 [Eutrema salsugineum]
MALYLPSLSLLILLLLRSSTAMWCVARFDVTSQALQAALDYACAAGADCAPIQPSGLCFLPNTIQAHASYAFNSYFQRRAMAPGSCNFAGTSTLAKTDPSYGSCVYPNSLSNAGGSASTTTVGGTPTATAGNIPMTSLRPPSGTTASPFGIGGGGLIPPGTTDTDESGAYYRKTSVSIALLVVMVLLFI